MQFVDAKARNQKLSKDTAVFLAGCALVRATRAIGRLRYGVHGFLIFVVPQGYRTEEYEAAALAIIRLKRDDWVDKETWIRLANPPRKKGIVHRPISIFDLTGLDILMPEISPPFRKTFASRPPRYCTSSRRRHSTSTLPAAYWAIRRSQTTLRPCW